MKKKTAIFLCLSAAGAAAAAVAAGRYCRAMYRKYMGRPDDAPGASPPLDAGLWSDVSVRSRDGLFLHAKVLEGASSRWAICVHGYRESCLAMSEYAAHYQKRGWNVLLPDLRSHGQSGGNDIGMGWPDRLDLLGWIGWIMIRSPGAEIVLHGVSMGASTVLMATGEPLPSSVRAAVSDCAFASAQDQFHHIARRKTRLPFPLAMFFLNRAAQASAGFSFGQASAVRQVKKSVTPTLFLHGACDDFVPVRMAHQLYRAAACRKNLVLFPGAGHEQCMSSDPGRYWGAVDSFLNRHGMTAAAPGQETHRPDKAEL